MNEDEFFRHLEMRVCLELSGMREKQLRWFWCDGFIPEAFEAVGDRFRMTGRVWMAHGGRHQSCWQFVLLLGSDASDRDQVDWAALIPGADVTGWLSLDFETRFMKINPFAAIPDNAAVGNPATPHCTATASAADSD